MAEIDWFAEFPEFRKLVTENQELRKKLAAANSGGGTMMGAAIEVVLRQNHELREKLKKAERQVESHLKELIRTRNELDEAVHTLDRLKAHQFRAAIEALREKAKTHRSWSPEQPSAYTVAAAWLESQAPKSEALLPAISPDDERVVDELMSKRAAGLGERSMVPKAEPDAEAEARRRLARNGRVSTSGLTPEQVAFSRAFDELHVEPDGTGWVTSAWKAKLDAAERSERGEKP